MTETTKADTLAHEQIAKEEQAVGVFFAAFAVQYLLHKDMLQNKMTKPNFLKIFGDMSLSASQRMFVKELIARKPFNKVVQEMQNLYIEVLSANSKQVFPHVLFFSRIQKGFLIRQIFQHSDQVLPKYEFVGKILVKDVRELNFDELNNSLWTLPVEQQILVISRIFVELGDDNMEKKRKNIIDSFSENIARWKIEMKKHTDDDAILNSPNIVMLTSFVDNYYSESLTP